ncbi:MAG: DEAD/DEAH box helicase [Lachnospiraceae bacterium]|nr:DEAD/DEAH box helicase [Lachnospiraceae bacterium]
MNRVDFHHVNVLLDTLSRTETYCREMYDSEEKGRREIREVCRRIRLAAASESLADIPVEDLKQQKAGIRTAVLRQAGFGTLRDLDQARDDQLERVDGIGEKQVAAIRSILNRFKAEIAARKHIQVHMEPRGDNAALVTAIARYRACQPLLTRATGLYQDLQRARDEAEAGIQVRSGFRWFFAGKQKKAQTQEGVVRLVEYMNGADYRQILEILSKYRDASKLSAGDAFADFERNSADYYALIESVGEAETGKKLLYGSVPEQLAAEIDALPLDLSAFKGHLRSYQAFGAKYVLSQRRVLLGDEMGLGKTVQAVAVMAHLRAADPGSRFLVVCPASVLVNWCREIRKFSALEPFLLHGAGLRGEMEAWVRDSGVAVTNYESMGKVVSVLDGRIPLDLLVIDEAHYMKNPDAQRTRHIRALDDESARILMMTGTPLENRVSEMCSLIDFIRPDMSEKVRKAAGMSGAPEFREMISPLYLRRLREQVLDELPPMEEKQEWCILTKEDRAAYTARVAEGNFAAMRRVSWLQEDLRTSAKARRMLELIEEAEEDGRKVILYSFFRETIRKAEALLGDRVAGVITGSSPPESRQEQIDRFTAGGHGSVLICQVQAGGTGLNIQTASVVIFCEPQIKPSLAAQAVSRVYRMGQVRNVLVCHLLSENTVDEHMVRILEQKQREFDAYADPSVMAEAMENVIGSEWIRQTIDAERMKYLPAVVE